MNKLDAFLGFWMVISLVMLPLAVCDLVVSVLIQSGHLAIIGLEAVALGIISAAICALVMYCAAIIRA